MKSSETYLIGGGGHGRVVLDAFLASGKQIDGILDAQLAPGSQVFGVKVLGDDEFLESVDPKTTRLVNGVGSTGDSSRRIEIFERFSKIGFEFIGVVHVAASIGKECSVDASAQIMAGAVLQNRVSVGKNVVVNTRASVDHDVLLADHVTVSPGAIVSGGVKLGRGTFVGAGAVIIQGIEVGQNCIVGAGAVVRHNVKGETTVVGNPATQLE